MTIDLVSEIRDALTGGTLVWIEAASDPLDGSVRENGGGNVACFRADAEHGCRLASTRQRGGPHGGGARIYEDFEGRRVVRVTERERLCTLWFGDGEALHLEAVVNEDGCRLATRSELRREERSLDGAPRPPAARLTTRGGRPRAASPQWRRL